MEEVLVTAVEALRRAMVEANKDELEHLTLGELSYGHTSGLVENKNEFVDAIAGAARRDVFNSIELSEHAVSITDGAAVARHRFRAEVLVNGVRMEPDIRVMQVWILSGSEWKLLARQAYKV